MVDLGRVADRIGPARVPTLSRPVSPLDDVRSLLEVTRLARAFRPHIVHTHLAKAGLVGRVAGRLAGARAVVHTYHGSVFRGYFGERSSGLYIALERWLARISTLLIAVTPSGRRELVDLGIAPERKIAVVPLGLDLARLRHLPDRADARRALGIDGAAMVVGIVGRLVPIKDVGTFLRAFALVRERLGAGAVALVVGDGVERLRLESAARALGLGEACRFLGFRADVAGLFAAMDVVVLTSLNEGSPVAIIEAMAAGKAVVATSVGGVPDVVTDGVTGMLVPPAEPVATADAIVRVVNDTALRERLGAAAAAAVYPRFAAERLVRDIESLYTELVPLR